MNRPVKNLDYFRIRLYFTGIVTIAIWSLLAWNHYHGGVQVHHLLARKDMPGISNWWGGLLLPLLSWFLLYRIQRRVRNINYQADKFAESVLSGFVGALFFGIILSVFFVFGYTEIPGYMLIGLLFLALFFPIYRAECILGFVIGMTFIFGAVLPTIAGSVLAFIAFLIYQFIRPAISFVRSMFTIQ